jgi:hypothetical protein
VCAFACQDLVLNFFVATFDEDTGSWTYALRDIAARYVKSWFWIDLVRGADGVPCPRLI